jgi:hypothetical protein
MAIGIQAPAAPHIINAEVPTAEMLTYETLLERFSNTYVLTDSIEGGFFLRKKPLCGVVSVYSNWRTAITSIRNTQGVFAVNLPGWINNCLVGTSSL